VIAKVHALTAEHDGLREEGQKAAATHATIDGRDPAESSMLGLGDEKLSGQVTFYNTVFVTEPEQIRRSYLRHDWETMEVGHR
jgi:hypothetical protein